MDPAPESSVSVTISPWAFVESTWNTHGVVAPR
jgi:hypothetical protein